MGPFPSREGETYINIFSSLCKRSGACNAEAGFLSTGILRRKPEDTILKQGRGEIREFCRKLKRMITS